MAQLESLTPEQEALCEIVFREYDGILDSLPRKVDRDAIDAWLKIVYGLYDKPVPARVEIVDSPFAAFRLEKELTGSSDGSLDWCGVSDSGWVSFYDYFHRIGVIDDAEAAEVLALREFQRSAWDTILLDECAIVVVLPVAIRRDEQGNLHSASGPCIEWRDGEKDFSWHGVWVPERMIVNPKSYTRAEYEAITSTEERRALGESAGWDYIVAMLGATSVDEWKDPETSLEYGLWRSGAQQWIRKQSPVLQSGAQPFYFEPVHEDLRTARAARKWQACRSLSPAECERDPSLSYRTET